jgi:hypothetical protein
VLAERRRQTILEELERAGSVSVAGLLERLGVLERRSELGAGAFIVDALPETTAAKLREAVEKAGG